MGVHGGVLYCIHEDYDHDTDDIVGLSIVNCVYGLLTYTNDDEDINAYLEYISTHA